MFARVCRFQCARIAGLTDFDGDALCLAGALRHRLEHLGQLVLASVWRARGGGVAQAEQHEISPHGHRDLRDSRLLPVDEIALRHDLLGASVRSAKRHAGAKKKKHQVFHCGFL